MSNTKTLAQIVQLAITKLDEVAGTSVQTYSEPRLENSIQSVFDQIFDMEFWPQYSAWYTWALDGATGTVTTDISSIVLRRDDIAAVYREGASRPLPIVPKHTNPYVAYGGGTTPLALELFNGAKLFRCWPLTSTGNVNVYARTVPSLASGAINFDSDCLALGAAYEYIEADASNPGLADMFRGRFEERLKTLRQNVHQFNIPYNAAAQTTNTEWFERT